MKNPNSGTDFQSLITPVSKDTSRQTNKPIIILIVTLFIITILTAIALFYKSTRDVEEISDERIRIEVKDLYPRQSIEIVEPLYVRARFAKIEDNVLTYGIFNPVGHDLKTITLTNITTYACTSRYWIAPDGSRVDTLNMLITTNGNNDIREYPDPPNAKDINWFKENTQNGEAIQIYFIKNEKDEVIPRIIYVYKDSC